MARDYTFNFRLQTLLGATIHLDGLQKRACSMCNRYSTHKTVLENTVHRGKAGLVIAWAATISDYFLIWYVPSYLTYLNIPSFLSQQLAYARDAVEAI